MLKMRKRTEKKKTRSASSSRMKRIFEPKKGVPYKIWFDNPAAALIIGKNRKRTLVEQLERFALHYRLEINFCPEYLIIPVYGQKYHCVVLVQTR